MKNILEYMTRNPSLYAKLACDIRNMTEDTPSLQ